MRFLEFTCPPARRFLRAFTASRTVICDLRNATRLPGQCGNVVTFGNLSADCCAPLASRTPRT